MAASPQTAQTHVETPFTRGGLGGGGGGQINSQESEAAVFACCACDVLLQSLALTFQRTSLTDCADPCARAIPNACSWLLTNGIRRGGFQPGTCCVGGSTSSVARFFFFFLLLHQPRSAVRQRLRFIFIPPLSYGISVMQRNGGARGGAARFRVDRMC